MKRDLEYTKQVFGKNLKYYRFVNKLTQQQLAEKLDCDTTYISDMERGAKSASFATLTDIANTLNIKIYQLFDERHQLYLDSCHYHVKNDGTLTDIVNKIVEDID